MSGYPYMHLSREDREKLRVKVKSLAQAANKGDENASKELNSLIHSNTYVNSLAKKELKKIKKQRANQYKKKLKRTKGKLRGSIMTGLSGKTGSRNWKTTK